MPSEEGRENKRNNRHPYKWELFRPADGSGEGIVSSRSHGSIQAFFRLGEPQISKRSYKARMTLPVLSSDELLTEQQHEPP
jgi:hypothetical protein